MRVPIHALEKAVLSIDPGQGITIHASDGCSMVGSIVKRNAVATDVDAFDAVVCDKCIDPTPKDRAGEVTLDMSGFVATEATDKQKRFIVALAEERPTAAKELLPASLDGLTQLDASELIDKLREHEVERAVTFRWRKIDGKWYVVGPQVADGTVVTVVKADGTQDEMSVVLMAAYDDDLRIYNGKKVRSRFGRR